MNFLKPLFLAGALAAAIPIVIHLMRRHVAPDVPFSAVRLLKGSPVPRAERRRLREWLLLAARVTALLLLAAAFARPYVMGAASVSPGLRIIAIDRSLSMGPPGRFAEALAKARHAVDDAAPGERIAVIAFDDRADVIAEPGAPGQALAAIARLEPTFGGTRYAPVFARASDLADQSAGRLIVITDLQKNGLEDQPPPALVAGLRLDIVDAGPPSPNLAVVGVRAEGERLVASLRNTGREPRRGQLRVVHDGRLAAEAQFDVAGESNTDVSVRYRAPASGSLAVSLDDREGLAGDNTRFLVPGVPRHDVLLIVSSGGDRSGFYVSRALAAGAAGPGTERVAPEHGAAAVRTLTGSELQSSADLSEAAALVLLSTRGLDRRGRDAITGFVRSGGGILIAASQEVEPSVLSSMFDLRAALSGVAETTAPASLSITDLRHPVFRPFGALAANLGQVRFERAWRLPSDGWEVAARFSDGAPALLERPEGKGRVVLFASDLDRRWNDFPVQPSFVPFAVEAVRYVSGVDQRVSDHVVSSVPPGVPPRPGVYRTGSGSEIVAVNVDPRESDSARVAPEEFAAAVERARDRSVRPAEVQARQVEEGQGYWQYGLLLMIGALVAESFVGRA